MPNKLLLQQGAVTGKGAGLERVVLNAKATVRSTSLQSSSASATALAVDSSVLLISLGTPMSFCTPSPDTTIANRSTRVPSQSGRIFPSQLTVRGMSETKAVLTSAVNWER